MTGTVSTRSDAPVASSNAAGAPSNAPGGPSNAPGGPSDAPGAPPNGPGAPSNAAVAPSNAAGGPSNAPGAPPNAPGAPPNVPITPPGRPSPTPRASSALAREATLTPASSGSATQTEASGAPVVASPTSRASAHHDAGDASSQGTSSATRSAAATGASAGGGAGTVADLAQAATGERAPITPASTGQAPPLDYGAGLQQAIESAHAAIQLAARQGLSQARIALQPEELGEIRIYLSQTAEGLVARLTAQTPAAAQALAAGHNELRQSLSSIGISLTHLDIGHLDQSGAQGGGNRHPGEQAPLGARDTSSARAAARSDNPDADPTGEQLAPQAQALSDGALVDVLV